MSELIMVGLVSTYASTSEWNPIGVFALCLVLW